MRNLILFTIIFCFFSTAGFSQQSRPQPKQTQLQPPMAAEVSAAEWKTLTDALLAEDWNTAAPVAAQHLQKLKIDNDKKQAAQLRYFYLYALAGKILDASSAKIPNESDSLWKELDEAVSNFIGKDFVLPPRVLMNECTAVLNYICPVKGNERALRVAATNRDGTRIHSFDYVLFNSKIALSEYSGKETFLGGRLKKAEFNQDATQPWVMRLIFETGFVRVIVPENK